MSSHLGIIKAATNRLESYFSALVSSDFPDDFDCTPGNLQTLMKYHLNSVTESPNLTEADIDIRIPAVKIAHSS